MSAWKKGHHAWRRVAATAAIVVLVALAASGCSRSGNDTSNTSMITSTTPSATSSPSQTECTQHTTPGFPNVDRCDVESVMTAVAARIFTFRPATEQSPEQAFWAAAPLMTQTYRDQVGVSAGMLASVPGRQWQEWAAADTRVQATARVTSDEHPTGTSRVVAVTQHFRDRSGRTVAPDTTTVLYMIAARDRSDGTYAVSAIAPR